MNNPISLAINTKDIERRLKKLSKRLERERKGESARGMARVLNRQASSLKTQTVKEASKRLDVKQKYIRKRIFVRKANSKKLRSGIWAGLNKFNALSIGAKPSSTGYAAGPYIWPNAFKYRNKKGREILLQRKGRARYPLEAAALGASFVARELKASADKAADQVVKRDLNRELEKELNYRLKKFLNKK